MNWAFSIASLISFTPDSTAEIDRNSESTQFEMTFATEVLPTPGGPQRIIEGRLFPSIATFSDCPSPSSSICPIMSSTFFGLSISASGLVNFSFI